MAFSMVNNSAELSDLTFLHLAEIVTCAGVEVASVGVGNSHVEELRSWVLRRGSNAESIGPHSGPHCKELAVSTVGVVAEYLEHYQTYQWSDRNIEQKDCYVHDDLQVGQ